MSHPTPNPQRRTLMDLDELFDAVGTTTAADGTRSAPMRLLPELIDQFEARRGLELLSEEEKKQMRTFALAVPEQSIGPSDLVQLLGLIGSHPSSSTPGLPLSTNAAPPDQPPTNNYNNNNNNNSSRETFSIPRRRISSRASTPGTPSRIPSPAPSQLQSPNKRLSFLDRLTGKSKPSTKTDRDVTAVATKSGASYLGVELDGPLGGGWDPELEADKLRGATLGVGTRESLVIDVLADRTFPQLRAIDAVYHQKYDKTLLELIESEGALKNNMGKTLKGLVMGPLSWDVELLFRATESVLRPNEHLAIELLVGRPPSAIALLRAAFARRRASSLNTPLKGSRTSLDDAVAIMCLGNARLKKVWETVLAAKWDDGARVGEDVDQLRIAFRAKPANVDVVSKVLLARSPEHLHAVVQEFKKAPGGAKVLSLTKSIKTALPAGQIRSMLLYAVEGAKNDVDGAWREAKWIHESMVGVGTKNDELAWRLVRAHWDRPRFRRIQAAYAKKYHKQLAERVHTETSSHFQRLLEAVVASASRPEPVATPADVERLDALVAARLSRSRSSSMSSMSSRSSSTSEHEESAVLEGDGELEQPPSPRSPPPPPLDDEYETQEGESTPLVDNFGFGSPVPDNFPGSPPLSSTMSASLSGSTSSADSNHRISSSLSFRQRSAPLDAGLGHKPPSSAGGSGGSSKPSALRHSRPVAPARTRRQSGDQARPGSTEPANADWNGNRSGSRSPTFARSPTPSSGASDLERGSTSGVPRALSSSGGSFTTPSTLLERRRESSGSFGEGPVPIPFSPPPGSPALDGELMGRSPPAGVDTTSYHAPPISPILADAEARQYSFSDLPVEGDYYASRDATPERGGNYFLRREASAASSIEGSRPGSMFVGEGFGAEGGYRPDSMFGGRPGSTASGGSGDQFQVALRQIQDLQRKLKDSEERYQQSSSTFEQEHSELEGRLEEARAELQTKRREDKELRHSEREHLATIASLEADVAKLTKQAERNREQYETMKRNYQDQCTEAEKLRTLVAETRRENRAAEEAAHNHGLQVGQFERDRELLQAAINKLEEDLSFARRAQDQLDDQKQENLLLKETIDRLRFDMDELRGAGRKSLFLDGSTSGGSSTAGSLSRTLGAELLRRKELQGDEEDPEADEAEDSNEEVDDIVVTTHRRVKKRTSKSGTASAPVVTHVEETTVVCDANTQTEPVKTTEMDVQTDLAAVVTELIVAPTVEPQVVPAALEPPEPKTPRQVQEELASELGIEFNALQDFIKGRKRLELPPSSSTTGRSGSDGSMMSNRRTARWGSRLSSRVNLIGQAPSYIIGAFPSAARPFVSQVLDTTTSFALYSICLYFAGVISGGLLFPLTHQHNLAPFHVLIAPGDRALWHQYNTFGSSWGEGLSTGTNGHSHGGGLAYWLHELVWGGVSVARRFPS